MVGSRVPIHVLISRNPQREHRIHINGSPSDLDALMSELGGFAVADGTHGHAWQGRGALSWPEERGPDLLRALRRAMTLQVVGRRYAGEVRAQILRARGVHLIEDRNCPHAAPDWAAG